MLPVIESASFARILRFNRKLSLIIDFTKVLLSNINEIFLHDLQYYTPDMWEYYEF